VNRRQLKSNRFLPKYVTSFLDRHGKPRLRFRRSGYPTGYFHAVLGTEAFRSEYAAFMDPGSIGAARADAVLARTIPGSIGDLFARYVAVPERLGPTAVTQTKVRAVLEKFVNGREDRPTRALTFEHLDAIFAKRRVKVKTDRGFEGGVEAARKLRKELVRLFDFAIKAGLTKVNPASQSGEIKVAAGERSLGYYAWSEDDIDAYRAHWPLGTKQRLAMELLLWTDQRKVDTIHLGRQHIREGRFHIRQSKTGKSLKIMVAPQLMQAIVAMPPSDNLCYLATEYGKPFTVKGFGGWFRDQCNAAGLPRCTAHGLRKATMRRMAELDMSNQTMKAMSGHTEDSEVAHYTASANQMRMADGAVSALSRWERLKPMEADDAISALPNV
jgi:integrase